MLKKITPIYHHCSMWEDWKNKMFRSVSENGDDILLDKCVLLLRDKKNLNIAMRRVINEWRISTQERLTKDNTNKKAWLGWAACSISHGAPDFITRKAWGMLTESEKEDANLIAEKAILLWYRNNNYIEEDVCQLSLWG
jgi:hypothetical protein